MTERRLHLISPSSVLCCLALGAALTIFPSQTNTDTLRNPGENIVQGRLLRDGEVHSERFGLLYRVTLALPEGRKTFPIRPIHSKVWQLNQMFTSDQEAGFGNGDKLKLDTTPYWEGRPLTEDHILGSY